MPHLRAVSDDTIVKADGRSVRGVVLSMLRDSGPLPRIEVARRSGLSATTITRTVNQLIDDGIIAEGSLVVANRPGRPATELAIRPDTFFVVGVQIGVGFAQLSLIDVLGRIREPRSFEYPVELPAEAVLNKVAKEIVQLLDTSEIDRRRVLGVGVAVPGAVDAGKRRLLLTINLSWRDVPVADIMEPLLGLPVVVEHNVRSMAVAEVRFGIGRGLESLGFVYLRTGLGAGLVVEGHPFSGGVHGAIEIGHLQVLDADQRCVCGNKGCLETVVSDRALSRAAADLDVNGENLLRAIWDVRDEDPRAELVIDRVVAALAQGLATFVNLLNPELILLGGALGAIPRPLFDQIVAQARAAVFPVIRESVQIEPSSLGGDVGMLGGAAVVLEATFYS